MPKYAMRPDANQAEIVAGIRQTYGPKSVFLLHRVGDDFPDTIVGVRGRNLLLEIKTAKGKLSKGQEAFFQDWQGQKAMIRTLDEALQVIERETT